MLRDAVMLQLADVATLAQVKAAVIDMENAGMTKEKVELLEETDPMKPMKAVEVVTESVTAVPARKLPATQPVGLCCTVPGPRMVRTNGKHRLHEEEGKLQPTEEVKAACARPAVVVLSAPIHPCICLTLMTS
jgi:hypothetical protein